MQTLVAIFLLVIALTLLWAWRNRKISNDTLNAFAAIFTVIAGIAAIILFLVPAASPPPLPIETNTPEIGSTPPLINTAIIEKTLAPSEIVSPLTVQPSPNLEVAKNKLKQVEQKLVNITEGVWIPVPEGVFQPSIQSILDDLASANYNPPPSSANDLVALAKDYMKASDFNKAFATFLEASKLDENNPEPHFWMGLLLPATGGPPEVAILSLGEAIEKDRSQQRLIAMFAYMQRGILYLMTGDPEQSLADFSECIQISGSLQKAVPIFMQRLYVDRGIAYQYLGKTHEALQDYEKALDFAAQKEDPLVVKKIQELVEEIDKAIPANTPFLYNVEGRLLWNDEPIQGIEVKMATKGTTPFITVTNELGRYIFSLAAGEYQLSYRFPGQISWTSSQTTPHFSPYKYVQEPILIEAGKVTSLDDIYIMKVYDLKITYPAKSGQELPPIPTFEWQAYPSTDYYQIWIYESTTYQGTPVLIPADLQGNPGQTRTTAFAFGSPLSASKDYYEVWVIAYNANGHELADYRTSFVIEK